MGDRRAKDALFDGLPSAAKALGSGRRAKIIDLLAQGERPVGEIARLTSYLRSVLAVLA